MPGLPHPQQLAALGAVLCLYRTHGGELAGWSQAVRTCRECRVDIDGPREGVQFIDLDGRCCWQLFLLPDTDFLAWERMTAGMPDVRTDVASGIAERLWRRLANRLGHSGWQASVLRFHALAVGSDAVGTLLLAASLPRLSQCGADVARRIARSAGIERDHVPATAASNTHQRTFQPLQVDGDCRWLSGSNTRTHA